MFNIFKKVKNKVNTSEKDYSLSYDNLAIPEIHKKDSDSEKDDLRAIVKEGVELTIHIIPDQGEVDVKTYL